MFVCGPIMRSMTASSSDGDDGDDTEPESGNDGSHDEEGKVAGAAPRKRLAALLRRSDIDAVSIALPIVLQPAFVRRALAPAAPCYRETDCAYCLCSAVATRRLSHTLSLRD